MRDSRDPLQADAKKFPIPEHEPLGDWLSLAGQQHSGAPGFRAGELQVSSRPERFVVAPRR